MFMNRVSHHDVDGNRSTSFEALLKVSFDEIRRNII